MNTKPNILICPLEWGLGHAARMIPLARMLSERNCRVLIGAGEIHSALFRAELPELTYINFPGFSPGYSRFFPQYLAMFLKAPLLLFHIISEHRKLKRIITQYKIDVVISDNRFGLWNRSVTSVYVTHILRIPLPPLLKIFEMAGIFLNRYIIRKYDHCIIPDLPGEINLSGKLSHNIRLPENARYIGILSRFDRKYPNTGQYDFTHHTIILSGPEPQRGMLRNKLLKVLQNQTIPVVILEGQPGMNSQSKKTGIIISYPHLSSTGLAELLKTSTSIISRSGYTTIMDLVFLNCSAFLIPTPGQTEQEYLADSLSARGWFRMANQKDLANVADFSKPEFSVPGELVDESRRLLESFLDELLEEKEKKKGQNKPH